MLDHNDLLGRTPGFWLNRRVLVTGHTGFLGTWLAARLSGLGADLVGASPLPPASSGLFCRAGLLEVVDNRTLDLRDRARVEQVVVEVAPEIVFHLLPRGGAAAGLKRPLDCFDTTVTGTLNLLNAVRRVPEVRAVVIVTDTSAATGGQCPRAASLACAELVVASYRATYLQPADGIGVATLGSCALIGGGAEAGEDDLAGWLQTVATGDPGVVPARAMTSHPFLHVLDAVEACLHLARALCRDPRDVARAWSLGPLDPDHCGAALAAALGIAPPAPGAAAERDGRASVTALGRRPALDPPTAIAWAIDGYRQAAGEAHAGFLARQIDRFTTCNLRPPTVAPADGAVSSSPAANAKVRDVFLSA